MLEMLDNLHMPFDNVWIEWDELARQEYVKNIGKVSLIENIHLILMIILISLAIILKILLTLLEIIITCTDHGILLMRGQRKTQVNLLMLMLSIKLLSINFTQQACVQ